jgi:hypothetical protein
MSAVVAIPTAPVDPSAARKRRREILASQRQTLEVVPVTAAIATPVTSDDDEPEPVKKSRRVSDFTEHEMAAIDSCDDSVVPAPVMSTTMTTMKKKCSAKKPQMKYDPDVPMTKEEAAVWRREQRRKRNRESAALSRQRQRDRIAELEVELADWKVKVESIMDRIKKLEESSGIDSRTLVPALPKPMEVQAVTSTDIATSSSCMFVSPPVSPGNSSSSSSLLTLDPSPIASSAIKSVVDAVVDEVLGGSEFGLEHSDKMISRHAAS